MRRHLAREIGFTPAFIRVKEFRFAGDWGGVHRGFWDDTDRVGEPDEDGADPAGREHPQGVGGKVYYLAREGWFVLDNGNDCWCDRRGDVHTT